MSFRKRWRSGSRLDVVGFRVRPEDQRVRIELTDHLAVEGEPCDGSGSDPGDSLAPVTFNVVACSAGEFDVNMVAADTGFVIESVRVVVRSASDVSGQSSHRPETIELTSVPSSLKYGQRGTVRIEIGRLDSNKVYELVVVPLNDSGFMFNSGCSTDERRRTIRNRTSLTTSYSIYGCKSPGTYVWARLEEDGSAFVGTDIDDDDNHVTVIPTVEFSSRSYSGDEGEDIEVTVDLNGARDEAPDVPINITNRTAESSDYEVEGLNDDGELEFSEGDHSLTFTFDTKEDNSDCSNERITVSIGSLPDDVAKGSPTSATVTIIDDDECNGNGGGDDKTEVDFGARSYSVTEGNDVDITVQLESSVSGNRLIPISWSNTTAEDADYEVEDLDDSNRITISGGNTSNTFTVDTAEDDSDCNDEKVTFTIGSSLPSDLERGSSYETVLTIVDDDCIPSVSISADPTTAVEGDTITFTVTANPMPSGSNLTVNLTHKLTGSFFLNSPPRTVPITDGNSTTTFEVRTDDDETVEDEGSVRVNVVTGTGYTLGEPNTITVPVEDNDNVVPTITISASSTSVVEGSPVRFTLKADPAPTSRLTVNGTMSWPDREFYDGPLATFHSGSNSIYFTIRTHDDTIDERDRTFTVAVSTSTEYVLGNPSSIDITELDDDPTRISFGSSSYNVDEGRAVSVSVNLTLGPESTIEVPINVSGRSYTTTGLPNGELTFSTNTITAWFTVNATQDNSDCRNERIDLSFGDLTSLGLETGTNPTATVYIKDNDVCPEPQPDKPGMLGYTPSTTEESVDLRWGRASNAGSYRVLQCVKPSGRPQASCRFTEVNNPGNATSTTVSGLDTDSLHQFRVRAVSPRGTKTTDSDTLTVDLKPAPKNLGGAYASGQHRQVTLTWVPVPNPGAAYFIEQKFPTRNPLDSGWKALPHDGVEIGAIETDNGRLKIVVSKLYPGDIGETGRDYEFRIKAQSAQGKSPASNETTVTVLNERPTMAPGTPTIDLLVGNRGVQVNWRENVANVDGYQFRVTPDTPGSTYPQYVPLSRSHSITDITGSVWVDVDIGFGGLQLVGLTPDTAYTFSVRGYNGSVEGPAATSSVHVALTPTYWRAHQADHTAGYTITNTKQPLFGAIPDAAKDWTNKLSSIGLSICDASDSSCRTLNSDNQVVTITTEAPADPLVPSTTCGRSKACASAGTDTPPDGVGKHFKDLKVVFKDPPSECASSTSPCPERKLFIYYWTAISSMDHKPVPASQRPNPDPYPDATYLYLHAGNIALHEFGHTLGAPDFYNDYTTGLMNETPSIMNRYFLDMNVGIYDTDVDQLWAIYRLHSVHSQD